MDPVQSQWEDKNMKVPFLDLKAQYESIKNEIDDAIQQVIDSCAFAGGPFVEKFEKEFAQFCGSKYAVGVGSGTEALWLSLMALGIGPGDEVITVPNTFIATAEAISLCGATPVFVDIDEETYNMDVFQLEHAIANNTKAIIPVHLFGQMADMDPIMEIAKKYGLYVVEDACQAHGAEYRAKKAGTIGDTGCFSFYPGKNLGAYGDAGALITDNPELAAKTQKLRDHGQSKKYYHDVIGWNSRMDGLQGAVLSIKLKHLACWNEARRNKAMLYNALLAETDNAITPVEKEYAKHVFHIYAVRIKNRDELIAKLVKKDIYAGIHYPVPVHLQAAYHNLSKNNGALPKAEKCAGEFISLPMYPELSIEQIACVAKEIKNNCKRH
jgi:dTDP-4-amino-4,6-dideoxygalactose transaminase